MYAQGVVTIVSGAQPSSASAPQVIAIVISLLIGVANIYWNLHSAKRSRHRSVEDEFWFRKVVAPTVLDKALEFSSKWSAELSISKDLRGKGQDAKSKIDECKKEAETIILGCLCLKLFDGDFYKTATSRIDEIVDEVTECFYAVTSEVIDELDANKIVRQRRSNVSEHLLGLLHSLKGLQASF